MSLFILGTNSSRRAYTNNRKTTSEIAFPCRPMRCLWNEETKYFLVVLLLCFFFLCCVCVVRRFFSQRVETFHRYVFFCIAIWIFALGIFVLLSYSALCIWSLSTYECVLFVRFFFFIHSKGYNWENPVVANYFSLLFFFFFLILFFFLFRKDKWSEKDRPRGREKNTNDIKMRRQQWQRHTYEEHMRRIHKNIYVFFAIFFSVSLPRKLYIEREKERKKNKSGLRGKPLAKISFKKKEYFSFWERCASASWDFELLLDEFSQNFFLFLFACTIADSSFNRIKDRNKMEWK